MQSKFTLTCKVCGCKMELAPREQLPSKPVICQNCGQHVSDNDFSRMVNAMSALVAMPYESLDEGCVIRPGEGFKFEIAISPSPFADEE